MIPDLPASYVRHLVEPYGLGDVEDPHAAGESGSMVGGRGVRITLAYRASSQNGSVIAAARGRVFGCVGLRAPVSWLSETLEGRSFEQACTLGREDVLAGLAPGSGHLLPEAVQRGAELAVEALHRALGVARGGAPADPHGRGILVCRCIGVGDRSIRASIRAGAHDPEAIGQATGACTGCRSCRPDLMGLLDEELGGPLPVPPRDAPPLARIAWTCVGPTLRGLGLPLARVAIGATALRLAFGPPAAWACVSPIGAVAVARQILRDTVGDGIRVEAEVG